RRRLSGPGPRGPLLDRLLAGLRLHDALNEDPRRVDMVGVDLARLDQLLNLGDGDLARHRDQRAEVAGRLVEHQVAVPVTAGRADQREVTDDALLEYVLAPVELPALLGWRAQRHRAIGRVPPGQAAVGDL